MIFEEDGNCEAAKHCLKKKKKSIISRKLESTLRKAQSHLKYSNETANSSSRGPFSS